MTPELATATDRLDAAIERVGNLNRQLSAAIVALAVASSGVIVASMHRTLFAHRRQ